MRRVLADALTMVTGLRRTTRKHNDSGSSCYSPLDRNVGEEEEAKKEENVLILILRISDDAKWR